MHHITVIGKEKYGWNYFLKIVESSDSIEFLPSQLCQYILLMFIINFMFFRSNFHFKSLTLDLFVVQTTEINFVPHTPILDT